MKFFFFTCCIFSFQIVLGQKFTEVPTSSPIIRLNDSRADIADVDNDGDLDLIVAGEIELFSSVTILYKNNGLGLFTEVTDSKFEGVHYGAVAFVDIDGDQDQDLFITGENSTLKTVAKLYQNDGRGNFTEFEDTPFVNVANGKSAFSDIDGDQDQDLLLTGRTLFGQRTTNLYLNDGTGIFSEVTNTPFEGVDDSVVDFLDVDGDQDQDLLIMGSDGSFYGITKLYLNDGNGNFNEVENTPFFQRSDGSIASGDIDGDLDQDVIISGIFTDVFGDVKLYLNDGNGNFMEANSPFEGTSEVVMVDIDNDGDQDVITTGYSESFSLVARLYFNIGEGEFLNIVGNTIMSLSATALNVFPT
ncbi:MAG: VCBS repeat-containing protein, partial [Bacteroidota bacterium]